MVRLQPDLLSALDKFAADRGDLTRPEAVREVLAERLLPNPD